MTWKTVKLGQILTESKISAIGNNPDRRISVKLNKQGVEKRALKEERTGATKYYIRKAGQFIYGQQNLHKGAFGIIPQELDGFESSNDLPTFDIADVCRPEWLVYFFSQNGFYKTLGGLATGIGSKRIYPKQIFEIEIPLPPLGEQNDIIQRINKIEVDLHILRNINEKNEKLVKNLRSSILQDAIQGKLVQQDPSDEPAGILIDKIQAEKAKLIAEGKLKKQKPLTSIKQEEIPYELPKGWKWVRLGDILELVEYGTSEKAGMDNSQIPVLRMGNIQNGGVDYTDLKFLNRNSEDLPKLYLKHQDLLFNRTNSFELVGKTAIYLGNNDEYTFAGYLIRLRVFRDLINPFYVNNYINSAFFRRTQIEPTIVQQCGQANYNGTKLIGTVFPLPPKNEQDRIVKKTFELIEGCSLLDEQVNQANERSEKLIGSLLEGVFRG